MKTIGMIGGVAWPSTADYYRLFNEKYQQRQGGLHTPHMAIVQADFHEIVANQRAERWDLLGKTMLDSAHKLQAAGADFCLIACNTVHTADKYIEPSCPLPFLHIVTPTAEKIVANGYKTVGLLGSKWTMCGTYFTDRLRADYGLEVLIAEGVHQENVHNKLYSEIAKGIFTDETHDQFRDAIADLVKRGAECVILGCTEFNQVVSQRDSAVPLVDTVECHVDAAIELALS